MATVYRPRLDLLRIDANGHRIPLASTTVSVYNVTAAASLGTLASDTSGVIAEGSFTAAVGDVVEFSHATYPLTLQLTLVATQEQAYTGGIGAYVVENLYLNSTSKQVDLYALDTDNPDLPPVKIGTGKRGDVVQLSYQTGVNQNLDIYPIGIDAKQTRERTDFDTTNKQAIAVPGAGASAAEPYLISAFSADLDAAVAAIGADVAHLKVNVPTTYAANLDLSTTNIIVSFTADGVLDVTDATKTITLPAGTPPPNRQVFPGLGKVLYAKAALPYYDLMWWAGTGSSDDNHAFDQWKETLDNQEGGNGIFPPVEYKIKEKTWPQYAHIQGQGYDPDGLKGSRLTLSDATGAYVVKCPDALRMLTLEGFTIQSRDVAEVNAFKHEGASPDSGFFLSMRRMAIRGTTSAGAFRVVGTDSGAWETGGVLVEHCWIQGGDAGTVGMYIDTINSIFTLVGNTFQCGVQGSGLVTHQHGWPVMINNEFRGVNGSNPYNVTTLRTLTDITITAGGATGKTIATINNSDTFNVNDICHRLQSTSSAWEGIIIKLVSDKIAWLQQTPTGAPAANSSFYLQRFDLNPNQSYAAMVFDGDARSVVISGHQDEGFNKTLEINGNLSDAVLLNGALCQGFIDITGNANLVLGPGTRTLSCAVRDLTAGPEVIVNAERGSYISAGSAYGGAVASMEAQLIGQYALSGSQPVTRLQYDFSTKEHYNDALTGIASWNNIHKIRQHQTHYWSLWNPGITEPLHACADTERRQGPSDPRVHMYQMGLVDRFDNWLAEYHFEYDDEDGALDLKSSGYAGSTNFNFRTAGKITAGSGFFGTATLSGTPTAPTATPGTNTTQIATTAFSVAAAAAAAAALVDASPSTLDTLNELAAALGDDPNFATTIATSIGLKLAKGSNLSDLTDAPTALGNLGGTTIGKAIFVAANTAAVDTALGRSTDVKTLLGAATFAAFRNSLKVPTPLFVHFADETTASTTDDALYTDTVAAATLTTNGDRLVFKYTLQTAANALEKYVKVTFGGTTIFDSGVFDVIIDNNKAVNVTGYIMRVSNTVVRASVILHASVYDPWEKYTEITSLNLTTTGYDLVLLGTTPDEAGDITAKIGSIDYVPAP